MSNLKNVIKESMVQYAGAVLQSRALVDARDCLKPSARQIFYCLYTDKFLPSKPFKKTLKAIGSAARMYIHGDSSCEGVIMRAGQPFAMRYPLIEVEGNEGNLMMSGNWAAPRYTASRLSDFSVKLFNDIDKETIGEWRDNYDDTEQYPTVLPSKGFYNIVNGTMGIGIGAASSIPQFNIKDVNKALETLLLNPDASFQEIYCIPDFATGAILLNENEVKSILEKGEGGSCKLRSVIEFDAKERCFIVTEIPFSVYTNTICEELEKILEDENENPGIDRFNDLTGVKPLIKIYLTKRANPDKVLKYLYKNTSLQSFYSINITMLDEGRFPKVFTWKEALQAHIDHEKVVYRRGFEFDLAKIEKRIHIIDGLLICIAKIDEVIQTIKSSSSTAVACAALCKNYLLDEAQAKAVLDMKLAKLAHLEIEKLEGERESLLTEKARIENILNNTELFNNELIKGWRETAAKFGDERRTKIMNVESEIDEPTEIKNIRISLTNKNNIFALEESSLYVQRRGTTGTKIKLPQNEYIIDSLSLNNNQMLLLFSQNGNYYHVKSNDIPLDQLTAIEGLLKLKDDEKICAITTLNSDKQNILFFTKMGLIKKSLLSEYNTNRAVAAKALNLDTGDEIVSVLFTNDDKVGMLTEMGNFIITETNDIRTIGRTARGIRGIKLNDGDYVISAKIVKPNAKQIISVSGNGLIKRTDISEFSVQGKNTKGAKIQKLNAEDWAADFLPIDDVSEIVVNATSSCVKININDIPMLSKGTLGVKGIKLKLKDNVIGLN